jgi:hypothetical protein
MRVCSKGSFSIHKQGKVSLCSIQVLKYSKGGSMVSDSKKKLLSSQTIEGLIEDLEEFVKRMMDAIGNNKDVEQNRFYEGMAVACKLIAMKLRGEFEQIDEMFLNQVYENIKILDNEKKQDRVLVTKTKERCSFCFQSKEPLVKGPFVSICEECLQFGVKVMESQKRV